mgnify:CR=1 FL=1|jgi:hypothetical protein
MYNSGNSSKNVTGASIVDGTVETVDIADDAVTADKLANAINTDIATGVSGSTTAGDALPKAGGAMTGAITTNSTFDGVDVATRDAVLTSTTSTANAALPKAGGTMTGTIAGFTSTGIDDNADTTAITITSAEKVGFGRTDPQQRVDISTAIYASLGLSSTNAYSLGRNWAITSNDFGTLGWGGLSFSQGASNGANPSIKHFGIDYYGKVGIGTSVPTTNLTIGGTSSSSRVVPLTDNVGYIGDGTHRWQAIYAVSGTIQTSDERQKTEITNTSLGLDFIKQLRPVSYKWKVGGYDVGDGIEVELEPAELDAEGNVIKPAVMGLPKKEPIAGKRNHYGLIAQEVKEVLGDTDFGGWVIEDLDDAESAQSLRYDQFVSPLIKAVQEQQTMIEALEARVTLLETP